jgi:hypothetical protein
MNGHVEPLGKAWVLKYIQRNPRVKSVIGRPIEAARVNGAQPKQIQEFYNRVDSVRRAKNIRPKATTNPPSPPSPPSPLSLNYNDIDTLPTPQCQRDVYHMIQGLDNGHMTERETRAILRKAGKRIGQLTAQNAVSEGKIYSLESHIEELRGPKTRKRVVVDPNTKFANIDTIKRAMDEAAEQEARIKAREPEKEAKKTADELAKAKMQDFMFG